MQSLSWLSLVNQVKAYLKLAHLASLISLHQTRTYLFCVHPMLFPISVQEEYRLDFTIERFNLIPPQISRVVQYTPYNGSDLRLDTLYLARESL